ncbi:MAG: hypothetical protein AB1486_19185 [Planctomycetota bacterium]
MRQLAARVFLGWMRFAELLEHLVFIRLLGTLVYLLLLGPSALLVRVLRRRPIELTLTEKRSYWRPRQTTPTDLDRCSRQF